MRLLVTWSIRRKILAVVLLTSGVVLALCAFAFVAAQVLSAKRGISQRLEVAAAVIADNVPAAIVFQDELAAEETLVALKIRPHILSAHIVTRDGTVFARYRPETAPPAPVGDERPWLVEDARTTVDFLGGTADTVAPVRLDGKTIGAVHIRSGLQDLYGDITAALLVAVGSLAPLLLLAYAVAARLERLISRPILDLLAAMRAISADQDFSRRATVFGSDEFGTLAAGFNTMLERIETHDATLRAEQQRAEAANRAKSQFLANMSHELRTPLNAILGFSEMLKSESLGPLGAPRYRAYAADIYESGAHLLTIINDILDLSRVDAGRLELREDEVEVCEAIDGAIRLVRERVERAGLVLSAEIDVDLPRLRADSRLTKQVLLNLLSNAIKFTPEGGSICVRATHRTGGPIVISIVDTGIGIPAEEVPLVLQPFYQVDGRLERRFEGTGLGLSLAKSFVEAHGGSLEIQSAVGQGTAATIRFPPSRAVAPADLAPATPETLAGFPERGSVLRRRVGNISRQTSAVREGGPAHRVAAAR